MNPNITLPLQNGISAKLSSGELTFNQFLEDFVLQNSLNELILEYHQDHAGSPQVKEVLLQKAESSFDCVSLNGSFTTAYNIRYYYPCDALFDNLNAVLTWKTCIDADQQTIIIQGPIIWNMDN